MCRREKTIRIGLSILALVILLPFVFMIWKSFAGDHGVSAQAYFKVFLAEPGYLIKFWRSLFLSLVCAAGQTIISCMAALAFSKYKVKGWKMILGMMMLFMILPVQVTLLPNYILLDKLDLLNTWWALIIPSVFAPFGTVWLTFIFWTVPDDILGAARLDGANVRQTICNILVPVVKAPIVTLFILSFVESWNMVEQPLTFLHNVSQYPISIFLVIMNEKSTAIQSVCGILCLIPVTLLFLYYHDEFVEGIGNLFEND